MSDQKKGIVDRQKQYEANRAAYQNLKGDLVKHGNGKVSEKVAEDVARSTANRVEEKQKAGGG